MGGTYSQHSRATTAVQDEIAALKGERVRVKVARARIDAKQAPSKGDES